MDIQFNEIKDSIRPPGFYFEYDLSQAVRTLPSNLQELCLIGQMLAARIDPARWQGGTLHDMTSGGTYTGTAVTAYRVQIVSIGTPDNFQWSKDGGITWTGPVAITGAAQTLELGVTITFAATTGHAVSDEWRFSAWPAPTQAAENALQVYSTEEVGKAFGYGSMLHVMAIAALKSNNNLQLSCVGLADNGSGYATGDVTIAGTVTKAGSITLRVGNRKIEIAVALGDVFGDIAIALQNALADNPEMPNTFAVDTTVLGKVNFVAKNAGTVANETGLYAETTAEGITVTLGAAAMASGSVNPDVDDALAAIFAKSYEIIVTPYANQADLVKVRDHLDSISSANEQRSCIVSYAQNGTIAAATTLATNINHGRIVGGLCTNTRTLPIELASGLAAVLASEEDPAANLNNKEIKGVHSPVIADRFTKAQITTMLYNGVLPLYVGAGEAVRIVRAITTYVKNASQVADETLLDIQTIRTLDYARVVLRTMLSTRYGSKKKTQAVKDSIRSDVYAEMLKMQSQEYIENVEASEPYLIVQDSSVSPTRVDIEMKIDIVNPLHVVAGKLVLIL